MLLAVPPDKRDEILKLFRDNAVDATVIGEYTDTRRLELYYEGNLVGDLDMAFLHDGLPQLERKAAWQPPRHPEPDFAPAANLAGDLKKILGAWNVCSKEWVIRQYDHEVQGSSVLKPLVGIGNEGPGDAAVLK